MKRIADRADGGTSQAQMTRPIIQNELDYIEQWLSSTHAYGLSPLSLLNLKCFFKDGPVSSNTGVDVEETRNVESTNMGSFQ
jgi:hypothetical protein